MSGVRLRGRVVVFLFFLRKRIVESVSPFFYFFFQNGFWNPCFLFFFFGNGLWNPFPVLFFFFF